MKPDDFFIEKKKVFSSTKFIIMRKTDMKKIICISLSLLAFVSSLQCQKGFHKHATVALVDAFPNLPGYSRPVYFTHDSKQSGLSYVVEQQGRIWSFQNSDTVRTRKLFLDIRGRVDDTGDEMGLLSVAFHPHFAENKYFYVNYTAGSPRRTVISRFTLSVNDSTIADSTSEFVLLEISQPYMNHNGGLCLFGPDGMMYIGMGDGGSGGDPNNNAQNLTVLLGKILRINVDSAASPLHYSIPSDNPFVGNTHGYREEIWTYGMRNPWRFSIDPITNWMYCGDVGQNAHEEIDIIEKGKNYGWRIMEGKSCYNPSSGCDTTGLTLPIKDYGTTVGHCIIGGNVYRGTNIPDLVGAYVYGDYTTKRIWSLRYDGISITEDVQLLTVAYNPLSFGVDENNELYLCTANGGNSRIFKFQLGVTPPSMPMLLFPVDNDTNYVDTVGFAWGSSSPTVTNYRLVVAKDSAFIQTYFSDSTLTDTSKIISNFPRQKQYWWRVAAKNTAGWGSWSSKRKFYIPEILGVNEGRNIPEKISLRQNYPNPFNPTTMIGYSLSVNSFVLLKIYDVLGKEVSTLVNENRQAGNYSVEWNASGFPSGIYFARFIANEIGGGEKFSSYRIMVLEK